MGINLRSRMTIFLLLFIGIFLLSVFLGVMLRVDDSDEPIQDGVTVNSNGGSRGIRGYPQFITLPPTSAEEGEEFSYNVKVSDSDTPNSELILTIEQAPIWLRIKDRFTLYGSPVLGESNIEKVVIELSDGKNKTQQTFYLVIKEAGAE